MRSILRRASAYVPGSFSRTSSELPNHPRRCAGSLTSFCPLWVHAKVITNEAREFLQYLLEINSARVQNDVLNRIQESRDRLQVEIRKLLHEISRIAEQALDRARKVKEEGTHAVQSAIERLNRLEQDVSALV